MENEDTSISTENNTSNENNTFVPDTEPGNICHIAGNTVALLSTENNTSNENNTSVPNTQPENIRPTAGNTVSSDKPHELTGTTVVVTGPSTTGSEPSQVTEPNVIIRNPGKATIAHRLAMANFDDVEIEIRKDENGEEAKTSDGIHYLQHSLHQRNSMEKILSSHSCETCSNAGSLGLQTRQKVY